MLGMCGHAARAPILRLIWAAGFLRQIQQEATALLKRILCGSVLLGNEALVCRAYTVSTADCLQQPLNALAGLRGVFDLRRQDSHGAGRFRRAYVLDGHKWTQKVKKLMSFLPGSSGNVRGERAPRRYLLTSCCFVKLAGSCLAV